MARIDLDHGVRGRSWFFGVSCFSSLGGVFVPRHDLLMHVFGSQELLPRSLVVSPHSMMQIIF